MGFSFLMDAFDLLAAGRFSSAVKAYQRELESDPNDIGSVDGLAKSLLGLGRYRDALPYLERVSEAEKSKIKDHPGQHIQMSCAYWCLGDQAQAISLARGLCVGLMNKSVGMAPDQAGGATFGLILHYMAVTAEDKDSYEYSINVLETLNNRYESLPNYYKFPRQVVRQILGKVDFDAVYGEAVGPINSTGVKRSKSSMAQSLGIAFFHDGVIRRVQGDENGCMLRMKEVNALGCETDSLCWYLARHEVERRDAK